MTYREDFGDTERPTIKARVVVRVGGREIVREVVTDALCPMGIVQHAIASELGKPIHEVMPVTWSIIT